MSILIEGNEKVRKKEEKRMMKTWMEIKDKLYEKSLESLDETAKSLVSLSSILITIGFGVIATLHQAEVLKASSYSIWFSLFGFGGFMVSTILGILVIFRRPFKFEMLALPHEISSEWARIRTIKQKFLKRAYLSFGIGVVSEIIAMVLLVILG